MPSLEAVEESVFADEAKFEGVKSGFDSLIVLLPANLALVKDSRFYDEISALQSLDESAKSKPTFAVSSKAPGKRLVISPIGKVDRDYDDVRRFAEAARAGITRAKASGSVAPLVYLPKEATAGYTRALEVALISTFAGLYEPLQAREAKGDSIEKVTKVGFVSPSSDNAKLVNTITAIELGKRLARDIGGSDPERMSPINSADYIQKAFAGSSLVTVEIISDIDKLHKEYPLLHAVSRAALPVARHHPRVVRLEYKGEANETLLFAGKGVTYDTGGADIKAGGIMAGMKGDKIGAAAIAGFFKTIEVLKPKIHAIAYLGFVRNSVGSDAYVADEIILSRGNKRVQVGNTDAEGRMVLADCLAHLREEAVEKNLPNPKVMTCATLTGHAVRCVGGYTISLDNAPGRTQRVSEKLKEAGEEWGDPIEISTLRKEDYDIIAPKNSAYDILQCNNAASSATSRGHQFPAAFLLLASGLDAHGRDSEKPIAFSHIDIAGSACEGIDYQFGLVNASPLIAWTARYALPNL